MLFAGGFTFSNFLADVLSVFILDLCRERSAIGIVL